MLQCYPVVDVRCLLAPNLSHPPSPETTIRVNLVCNLSFKYLHLESINHMLKFLKFIQTLLYNVYFLVTSLISLNMMLLERSVSVCVNLVHWF